MKDKLPYDKTDSKSIEKYALKLLNKSLKQILGDHIQQTYKGKGKLGQILEELYFQYPPNSHSEPDFKEAGVELKTSPMKFITKGLVSKERLVFNIINYDEDYKKPFLKSAFWAKNQLLLLMFYIHEKEKIDLDYIFKIILLWKFPETDLKIIKDDWTKIISKIKDGKAHEISEGDTLYLGACTKGANKKSLRSQPFSDLPAMQRAFSLKSKYLNFIIENELKKQKNIKPYKVDDYTLDIAAEPGSAYGNILPYTEPVVKSTKEYKKGETFEDIITKRFSEYYGMSERQLTKRFGIKEGNAKNRYYSLARAIVGVTKGKIEEFEKADIILKTIRLQNNGMPKESMSFAQIKYKEIIKEQWEDSYLYEMLTKRFFFVVFQMKDGKDKNPILKKIVFWTMPIKDLIVAKKFWEHTQNQILNGDYEHFLKISDDVICHVRPKGADSKDLMETPQGSMEKKKSYWLNASYIKEIVN